METKLTTITPTYRSFVPDQILTAGQLNEFLNYFEDQDRLSRIFLSGVGIVCGFKVQFNQDGNGKLVISQGAGVTTDGDLLKLSIQDTLDPTLQIIDIPDLSFTHFRKFVDSNSKYTPFFWKNQPSGTAVQIPLWEAIPAGEESSSDPTIISRTDLNDLVVLLYLEDYQEDPNACTGIDCENLGTKNIRRLRVLFVSQSDADYILTTDSIFNANYLITTFLNLEEVSIQRVTVNATNSASFESLRQNYLTAVQSENIIGKLTSGFETMLEKLGMADKLPDITSKLDEFFGTGATNPTLYFQYRYDLLRDIVNAYNELKDLFLDSICACNPDIHSFPKHLLLGRLIPTPQDRYLKSYRHEFYKSPILKDEKDWCARFRLYVDRVIAMMQAYQPQIPAGEIKITPSSYRHTLDKKAIPFYYKLPDFPSLLNTWNYDKYQVNKQNHNLSYHTSVLDPSGPIQFPLNYNLEPHNFLAIEGQQGYTYQSALERINQLKYQYGLAFDVKALGLTIDEGDEINVDDYACQFEDLQLLLNAWTQEHECLLGKVSKYYSAFNTNPLNLGNNFLIAEYLNPVDVVAYQTAVAVESSEGNQVRSPKEQQNAQQQITEQLLEIQRLLNSKKISAQQMTEAKLLLETQITRSGQLEVVNQVSEKQSTGNFRETVELKKNPTNVVEENLYVGNDGLGKIMLPVFNRFRGCSGNDIFLQVNNQINQFHYPIEDNNIVEATLKGPNEVLSHAYVLMNKRPYLIAQILPSVIESINTTAVNLCGAARKTFLKASGVNLSKEVLTMLYNLAQETTALCCSAEKLQVIYDEIERRKQEIRVGLSLAKFQEEHPGMEHLGGVHQGDTFILVYIQDTLNGVASNTVVADFTLPYLCCSDCRPIGFVMPRVIVDLRLSTEMLCVKADQLNIVQLYKYPADGIVEFSPFITGITVNGNQLHIDPQMLPEEAYNQTIQFTINGQPTNAQLTLRKPATASMDVPSSPIMTRTVDMSCSLPDGVDPSAYTYFWEFGDGTTSTEKEVVHTYVEPYPINNTVDVKLTVTSGAEDLCPLTLSKTLTFEFPTEDEQDALDSISALNNEFKVLAKDPVLEKQPIISNMNGIYLQIAAYPLAYVTGKSAVNTKINEVNIGIYREINTLYSNQKPFDPWLQAFYNLMKLGLAVNRCQTEALFRTNQSGEMINVFTNELSPDNPASLWEMGVKSDTSENLLAVNTALNLRTAKTPSHKAIYHLLTAITAEPKQ